MTRPGSTSASASASASASPSTSDPAESTAWGFPNFKTLDRLRALSGSPRALGGTTVGVNPLLERRKQAREMRRRVARASIALAIFGTLLMSGLIAAEGYVADHARTRVALEAVEVRLAPLDWVRGPQAEALTDRIRATIRADLRAAGLVDREGTLLAFGADAMAAIGRAASGSPWVGTLTRVSSRFAAAGIRLRLDVTARTPALAVVTDDGVELVDRDAVVLPLRFVDERAFAAFNAQLHPPVRVVHGGPHFLPAPGIAAGNATLVAALNVDALLAPFEQLIRIESIDLANLGGRLDAKESHVVLSARTRRGEPVDLLWGRAPQHVQHGENTVGAKLQYLRETFAGLPRDPATGQPNLSHVAAIDLRFDAPNIRRRY